MIKKLYMFFCLTVIALLISSCGNKIFIDAEEHTGILSEMTPIETVESLSSGTILYIDASGVFYDAKRSPIFNDMKSQMYQYIETLVFVEGERFDTTECNRQKQTLFNAIENRTCTSGTNYADIQKAVEDICNGNHQGIVISDFEFYKDKKLHDRDPYLSESFKKWLSKGYQIDILVEPYYESNNLKKRFYMFFTNPDDKSRITNTMISQVEKYKVKNNPNVGECCLFTLNNKDISIKRNKENSSSEEIVIEKKNINAKCELVSIEASWNDIKEFLMKLDNHNKLIEDEKPIPIVDGLKLYDGNNYSIDNIKIRATNVSKQYLSKQEKDDGLNDSPLDISDAFEVKMNAEKEISIFFNKNILSNKCLYYNKEGFEENLLRVDLVVDISEIKKYDETVFQWNSIQKGKSTDQISICVSKSIENVLKDIEIVPDGRVLYTIYIQTPSFK